MATWSERSKLYKQEFDNISDWVTNWLNKDLHYLNEIVGKYIKTGGLNKNPNSNPNYDEIKTIFGRIESVKDRLKKLVSNVTKDIHDLSKKSDLGEVLAENGRLQQEIIQLEKQVQESTEDMESALHRDHILRTGETDINKRQLFLIGRPIKKNLHSWLWMLSVLFIAVGMLIFKQTMPSILPFLQDQTGTVGSFSEIVLPILMDYRVWGTFLLSVIIIIIILSLKVAKVF
jgi:hypothetical protein